MKGIQGLIVAIVLGVAGAAANFYYLNTEAQKKDMVGFIGIKKGVVLGRGDKLTRRQYGESRDSREPRGEPQGLRLSVGRTHRRQGYAGLADAGQQDR